MLLLHYGTSCCQRPLDPPSFILLKISIERDCFRYHEQQQIGLARVITDFATFAYLADVFILENHQGKSLGKWLMQTILEMKELEMIKNWLLFTKDAHGLYEQYGFHTTTRMEKIMERVDSER